MKTSFGLCIQNSGGATWKLKLAVLHYSIKYNWWSLIICSEIQNNFIKFYKKAPLIQIKNYPKTKNKMHQPLFLFTSLLLFCSKIHQCCSTRCKLPIMCLNYTDRLKFTPSRNLHLEPGVTDASPTLASRQHQRNALTLYKIDALCRLRARREEQFESIIKSVNRSLMCAALKELFF